MDGVEDEKHFVMNCPQYDQEHTYLFQVYNFNSTHFDSLNVDQKYHFIMTNERKVTLQLAKFVYDYSKVRDEIAIKS